jgi:hypothetical protein
MRHGLPVHSVRDREGPRASGANNGARRHVDFRPLARLPTGDMNKKQRKNECKNTATNSGSANDDGGALRERKLKCKPEEKSSVRRRKENLETSAHGRNRAGERVPGGGALRDGFSETETLAPHGNQNDEWWRGAISGRGNPSVLFIDWRLGRALTQEWSKNQKSTPNQNQIRREQIKRAPNFRFLHNKIQHATRCKLKIFHWNPD